MERARFGLTLALCGLAACGGDRAQAGALPVPGDAGPPIAVEVLNASARPGLARLATRVLRRAGIDVVGIGTALEPDARPLDSTRIVVRRDRAALGQRVRDVLGVGRVAIQRDSTRLLDVSVFLGRDFAPRLHFHP